MQKYGGFADYRRTYLNFDKVSRATRTSAQFFRL
jgi:hypothetical protein